MNSINATNNGRNCSLIILSFTLVFILAVVIAGVCVRFFLEGNEQRIILIVLICVLAVFGMAGVIVLEIRRRRAMRNKKRKVTTVPKTNNRGKYEVAPTAPRLSDQSSWHYSKNYSNRTTVQA